MDLIEVAPAAGLEVAAVGLAGSRGFWGEPFEDVAFRGMVVFLAAY